MVVPLKSLQKLHRNIKCSIFQSNYATLDGNFPSGNIPRWAIFSVTIFLGGHVPLESYPSGNIPSGNIPRWAIFSVTIFPGGHVPLVSYPSGNIPSGNIPRWAIFSVTIFPGGHVPLRKLSQWQYSQWQYS